MKAKIFIILLFLIAAASCKKEQVPSAEPQPQPINLTLEEARGWLEKANGKQPDPEAWELARYKSTPEGTTWQIPMPGAPQMNGITGYTKLVIHKSRKTGSTSAQVLDYLPDGHYLQTHPNVATDVFTGRIYAHDLQGKLVGGYILYEGKRIGEVSPDTTLARKSRMMLAGPASGASGAQGKISMMRVIEMSYWIDSWYIDGDGVFTIHSERYTEYFIYDDGMGYGLPGMTYDYNHGNYGWEPPHGGGGGSYTEPVPPAPEMSNLPGEDAPKVDPKKMTKCFGSIPDAGASVKVTVYVQEPFPGTSFNIGPNSFGHVAIGITKSNNGQSITQVMGFYPDASGLSRFDAPSKIIDNGGDLEYNVSATYTVAADKLNNILTAFNNNNTRYNAFDYNCTNFAYDALKSGGIVLPDPTVVVGVAGPGGASTAMTPAGLGQAYRAMKENKPNSDITTNNSTTPNSKGECNE